MNIKEFVLLINNRCKGEMQYNKIYVNAALAVREIWKCRERERERERERVRSHQSVDLLLSVRSSSGGGSDHPRCLVLREFLDAPLTWHQVTHLYTLYIIIHTHTICM